MLLKAELKGWGNSYGIRITKKEAKKLDLKKGDTVILDIKRKIRDLDGFGIFKGSKPFEREPDDPHRDW